jgi:septum formation inhibitor-activating ATPase MinD
MQLRTAERRQARMRLALQGVSGAGKTFSSLIIARGMTDSWSKIALIDTEHGSADLYAHLGAYRGVISQSSLFS